MTMRLAALLLFGLFLVAGCKSADELYNEGQALELRGDYEAAAYLYADALRKDRGLRKARGRLLEAGKVAVGQGLTRIDAAEDAGAWVEAADQHKRLDGLVRTAQGVGVTLPLPEGYAANRRANLDAAVAVLLDEGDDAVDRGDFARALARFDQARRYEPTPETAAVLAGATLDATAAWAEADFAAGNYRAAYDRAEAALALAGPQSPIVPELAALQNEALARGSVRVAFFPLWQTISAERDLPSGFLGALNDALDLDAWGRPPLFVIGAEPTAVRRVLRDFGSGRSRPRTREAAEIGRALDAHFAFAGEVERFEREVEEREREGRGAQTRGGDRVRYERVEDDVTLSATVTFDVIDTRTRDVVCEREVERSARGRVEYGDYDGSIRTLDLSRDERRLFDSDEVAEQEREIEDDLLDELAERVAEVAFDCLP
jgi:tetratricopeptide (TPR) repeat protein